MAREIGGHRRPYTSQVKARLAVSIAVLALGLLLVSTPGWLFKGGSNAVVVNSVVGLAGALIGYAVTSFVNEIFDPTYDAVLEAFDFQGDLSNPDSFRSTIRAEVSSAVAGVTATAADFGPRAAMVQQLATSTASSQILIQSISLSHKWQMAQMLEELFRMNPEFTARILLIHPYSRNASAREEDLGFTPGTIRQLVQESILPLASLKARSDVGERLQVRGYWAIPYFGLMSVDSERALVTLSREGRGGDQNHACLIHASTPSAAEMVADLERGFDQRWASSHDLMNPLDVDLQLLGTPPAPNGELTVKLQADVPLLADSVQVTVDHGSTIGRFEERDSALHIKLKPADSAGLMRVQVHEALSKDMHRWLTKPAELSISIGN